MNSDLHHKWNSERDGTRGSTKNAGEDPHQKVPANKVTLKQNKPR